MIKRADLYTCDVCKSTEHTVEGSYEVPLEWLTIRMANINSCSAGADLHICPECKYYNLTELWEKI